MEFETKAVHIGEEESLNKTGDVVMPIHLSSTFSRKTLAKEPGGFEYSRGLNPTRKGLEMKLASLDGGKYGYAFSSGLGAINSLLMALVKPGENIVASDDLYGGTIRLFNEILSPNFGLRIKYVDARDVNNVRNAIDERTKLVFIETPSNPLMHLVDIKGCSEITKEKGVLLAVDNTFASPYFQKPLALGADVAVYSTTKYLNGHSDSIGGAIVLNDDDLASKIYLIQRGAGNILSPFDSYLVMRGIKTLAVRMKATEANAMAIAKFLSVHNMVQNVNYPGLETFPQYELAKKQMSGFSGILSFTLKGDRGKVEKFVSNLNLFSLAVSLGGVESLVEVPAYMTHSELSDEERKRRGISNSLIRLSVGIENIDDLIADLGNSLSTLES
ncbi:MAG: PLP-dependent aspartate aminotransferase family protein [Thermoplasmatales archaeon]